MDQKTKKVMKISILVVSLLVVIIGLTYAYFNKVLIGQKKYVLTSSGLEIYLDESKTLEDVIGATGAVPVTDEKGKQNEGYYFDLVNDTTEKINYKIYLDLTDENTMPTYALRYNLLQEEENLDITKNFSDVVVDNQILLHKGNLSNNQRHSYTLRVWLGLQAGNDAKNKVFSGTIRIEAEQAVEYADNSGVNPPELTSGMIPVVYDEKSMVWKKADVTQEWYDYDNQMWANAVTVTEDTRDSYMAAPTGEPISMNDINTMWVWIPRYEYNYSNLGPFVASGEVASGEGTTEIKVNFISKDTTTSSDSSLYRIPEGFKFGEENISGFWIGKFETSTLESCTIISNSVNAGCDLITLTPQIKPGVTSWRGARISTHFQASRLMQVSIGTSNSNNNVYGFDSEETMDIHMTKNTEWGIVAMLSNSKYGKYGNPKYTEADKEIMLNNCSSYITGIAADNMSELSSSTTCITNTYETVKGQAASTTGTIYGVYDMSGGAWEHVMGNLNKDSGSQNQSYGNSGFCGEDGPTDGTCREWPEDKYYDLYTSGNFSESYKFGDATAETAWFYDDFYNSIYSTVPWAMRGGLYASFSAESGIFALEYNSGSSGGYASRFVIKP